MNKTRRPHKDARLADPDLTMLLAVADIALNGFPSDLKFQDLVAELGKVTGYPIIAIDLYDAKRRIMVRKASQGIPPVSAGLEIPLEESFSALVVQTGIPVIEADLARGERPTDRLLRDLKVRTFLCVPMVIEKTVIGTLSLGHTEVAPVPDGFVDWVTLAAAHTAFLYQRIQAEETISTAQQLESTAILTRGLSHDFNNLLMTMLGNITLARMRLGDREPLAAQRLGEAEKVMLNARKLTDQLFTFSGKGRAVKKLIDPGPILGDSIRQALRGSAVKADISIDHALPMIEADERQLRTVLRGIAVNARESMADTGILTVTATNVTTSPTQDSMEEGEKHTLHISIKDNGSGVKEGHLARLFDPYFTTKKPGAVNPLGLGLAVAQAVIKKHQGTIEVESQPGIGTTVHLTLPAKTPEPPVETSELTDSSQTLRQRILVIDDEEDVRRDTRTLLSHMGYDVALARGGNEGETIFKGALEKRRPFAAVILDLPLSNSLDGTTTLEKLMGMDRDVKVIAVGVQTTDPVLQRFKQYGFKGRLTKPYDLHELKNAIEGALGR